MGEGEGVSGESLAGVFEKYRDEMTGKARKLLQNAGVPPSVADADDIVSTAFLRAWRDADAVRQPRAYLYQVIRTEVVHLTNRRAEHRRLDERRAADPLCCPPPDTPDFSALVDNRDAVHRALLGLSVPQRTAVWATHALDYTRGETAVLMGKHPGTVARHTARAMLILRAGLAAAVVGVLTALLCATGGRLQRATPANDPRARPVLPVDEWWWTGSWVVIVIALIVGGCVLSVLLSRRQRGLPRRLVAALSAAVPALAGGRLSGKSSRRRRVGASGPQARDARSPMAASLCVNCHRLMDSGALTREQRNVLWRRVETESLHPKSGSVCQFCGHRDPTGASLETAHLLPAGDAGVNDWFNPVASTEDGSALGRPGADPVGPHVPVAAGPPKGAWPPAGSVLIDESDF
ncbi:RNA polymerase sigma factor [Streptomyces sp. NPDC007084]|uniref:RNA polymerase sigma factor n=1 Tax=Streptomyces sp. NPDC007084 TaxID=3154313 RepID=UPI003452A81A